VQQQPFDILREDVGESQTDIECVSAHCPLHFFLRHLSDRQHNPGKAIPISPDSAQWRFVNQLGTRSGGRISVATRADIGRFSGACTENASPGLTAKKTRQDREDGRRSGTSAKVPRFRHTVSSVNLSIRCI
jgi:hypothetical protein